MYTTEEDYQKTVNVVIFEGEHACAECFVSSQAWSPSNTESLRSK